MREKEQKDGASVSVFCQLPLPHQQCLVKKWPPGFKGGTSAWVTERRQEGKKKEEKGKRKAPHPGCPRFLQSSILGNRLIVTAPNPDVIPGEKFMPWFQWLLPVHLKPLSKHRALTPRRCFLPEQACLMLQLHQVNFAGLIGCFKKQN